MPRGTETETRTRGFRVKPFMVIPPGICALLRCRAWLVPAQLLLDTRAPVPGFLYQRRVDGTTLPSKTQWLRGLGGALHLSG